MRKGPIATIGYENATLAAVLTVLRGAGVEILADVRDVPNSRKPGFSKRQLAASLEEAGIAYAHLKGLGTPKAGREAARKGDRAGLRAIYTQKLETPEAAADMARLKALMGEGRVCLLCYERDPAGCHRQLVLERLGLGRPGRAEHLFVEPL